MAVNASAHFPLPRERLAVYTGRMRASRSFLIVLTILNCIVLLGQLWPEGAPPFARAVNILFLILSLFYFVVALQAGRASRGEPPR